MSKSAKPYLQHILEETNFLIKRSKGLSEDKFMRDDVLQRAFSRSLEIIGEAVKNLPNDFRHQHSDVEWKSIAGMRDRLIHKYFGVDYILVWDVVKNEIPGLQDKIEAVLKGLTN